MKNIFVSLVISTFLLGFLKAQTFTKVDIAPFSVDNGDTRGTLWKDIDSDGDPDLYLTNVSGQVNFFYLNQNGTFVKNDTSLISLFGSSSGGGAFADYDKDGDPDLFLYESTSSGTHTLFQTDSNYVYSTAATPINTSSGPGRMGAWADYDNDGYLDLFVALDAGVDNLLFHNNGNGSFTQITTGVIVNDGGNSRGGGWCDYDNDGDMDLFVSNYLDVDFLYRNDGAGNFTKITTGSLVNTSGPTFGASWGDVNNDGWMDIYITNFNPDCQLYLSDQIGGFTQVANSPVKSVPIDANCSAFGDLDNDGDLDLLVANGDQTSPAFDLRNNHFLNSGNGTFTQVTGQATFTLDQFNSQSLALADYDLDGYLDVAVANRSGQKNQLYNNVGGLNHWVEIKLEGIASNSEGIGARLRVLSGGTWQTRQVLANSGYRAQSDITAHFGLATANEIDSLIIYWPSGLICTFDRLPVDSLYTFIEACDACEPLGKTGVNVSNVSCPGESDGSLAAFGYPVNSSFLFALDSGLFQASPGFSPLGAGNYELVLLDDKGCKYFYTAMVIEPDSIQVNPQGISSINGITGKAWASPTGGTAPYTYLWNTGGTKDTLSGLGIGTYYVTVTDANGCQAQDSVSIGRLIDGLDDFPVLYSWNVYPTPSSGVFILEWDLPGATDITVEVFDLTGRMILQEEYHQSSASVTWDIDLPDGIFLLSISTDSYREVKRIIIQK